MKINLSTLFRPLAIVLCGYVANLLVSIMMTNMMSIDHFGIVNYAVTILAITSSFILLGTNSSSKRFLSSYLFEHNNDKTDDYVHWNLNIVYIPLKISFILSVFLFFIVDPLELFYIGKITNVPQVATFLLVVSPLIASTQLVSSFLLCDDHVDSSTFLNTMGYYCLSLIGLGLYYLFFFESHLHKANLTNILTVMFVSNLSLFLIAIYILKNKSPHLYKSVRTFDKNAHKPKESAKWLKNAETQLFLNITIQIISRVDYLLLVFFSPTHAQLAIYGIASKITSAISLIPVGLFRHLQNKISIDITSDEKKQELQYLWNQTLKYNVAILLILALLIQNCQPFLTSVFGPQYLPAMSIIKIKTIGFLIYSMSGTSSSLLQYSGYANYVSGGYIIKVITFIVSALILHPLYALEGIAYAVLISTIFFQIYLYICIRYYLNFKPYGIF